MGCSLTSSNRNEVQPIKAIAVYKIETLTSPQRLRPTEIENIQHNINCLKFTIKEETVDEMEYHLSMLEELFVPCFADCSYVYNLYQNFEGILSIFENHVHSVCIPEYNFIKGIKILITYLTINT